MSVLLTLRRPPVVFTVARLAWQFPVLLPVASALFSVVALAVLGPLASGAPAACNDPTDHLHGIGALVAKLKRCRRRPVDPSLTFSPAVGRCRSLCSLLGCHELTPQTAAVPAWERSAGVR